MKNKKRFSALSGHIWPLMIVLGIAIFIATFAYSAKEDMRYAEGRLKSTVSYINEQCSTYNVLNNAAESRSLIRIMESAQQISREMQLKSELNRDCQVTDADLEEYIQDMYLSGIILLNTDGTVERECSTTDGSGSARFEKYLDKTALLDVAEYPEKAYTVRIPEEDGSCTDLAAFGRKDQPGIVVAFYCTTKEYNQNYTLSFQHLLSGYNTDFDGTIVVTKGDKVIASNDTSLVGGSADDVAVLRNTKARGKNGKMLQVRSSDKLKRYSYAVLDRGRNYYVYAYMAERKVFAKTPKNLLYVMIIYFMLIIALHMIRWKMKQNYQEERLRKEQEYQKKLMESARKAESANVAKTEFLQRMSHDIRTPINGIRGMVEIGNHYYNDMEKQAECRQKIWEASGLLLELVNEVLDMGKLESGEVVLEKRPFNIVKLMLETKDVLEKTAAERGVVMECKELNLKHTELIGSPLHVKRLLMNILSNAVKYNKDYGKIMMDCQEVRATEDTVWIEFVCEDTGIGMSSEYQKHIFEPFTQESNDARSTYNGTGLGMAITKNLVDKMGGTITFDSKQGVGTRNVIVLPFRINHNAEKKAMDKDAQDRSSIEGMHILLVEDNDLNMEIAEFVLESAGAEVTKAFNGQEGVDKFRASKPGEIDAILMDVMMPVLDGYQATKAIRSLDREDAQTIPVVAMTANAFAEDRKKAEEAGMSEHLVKPLEPAKVIETLAHYYRENI